MKLLPQTQADYERENARLLGIIADAIAALNDGRMGDVRRILQTGHARPVLPVTLVIGGPA